MHFIFSSFLLLLFGEMAITAIETATKQALLTKPAHPDRR